jgi:3-deoxy-D-manno-octulosonic-acid transferase
VAGSTHAGEEALILDTFTQLKAKYADLRLLLAPRNKSDFQAVRSLIQERGLAAAHRHDPRPADAEKDIFLLDTLGELDSFYDLAEIALVCKSWAGRHKGGGHNPLEPASKG